MTDKTPSDITSTKTNRRNSDDLLPKEKDGVKYRKRLQREKDEEKYIKDELKYAPPHPV